MTTPISTIKQFLSESSALSTASAKVGMLKFGAGVAYGLAGSKLGEYTAAYTVGEEYAEVGSWTGFLGGTYLGTTFLTPKLLPACLGVAGPLGCGVAIGVVALASYSMPSPQKTPVVSQKTFTVSEVREVWNQCEKAGTEVKIYRCFEKNGYEWLWDALEKIGELKLENCHKNLGNADLELDHCVRKLQECQLGNPRESFLENQKHYEECLNHNPVEIFVSFNESTQSLEAPII